MNSTLLCRVENGEEYLPQFLEHYRALGIGHMVFLDTGSTDRTLDLLTGSDVTVHHTDTPFKTHRLEMRRWLMDVCEPGTWTINVDIDELLVFPAPAPGPSPPSAGSGQAGGGGSLRALIEYLDQYGYTAMRSLMLDMFPSGPVGTRDAPATAPLIGQYPWYDVSDIEAFDAPEFFGSQLPAYRGGIRKSLTGRSHFWLTKHPLIKTGCGVRAFEGNEHSVSGERLADVTGVLLHFKFTPGFQSYVDASVERAQHWNESEEYKIYQQLLRENPQLILKRDTAQRWRGLQPLIERGLVRQAAW